VREAEEEYTIDMNKNRSNDEVAWPKFDRDSFAAGAVHLAVLGLAPGLPDTATY
jgi:hypothetical protein